MSKMPELLPFYALPYVTDPLKNPVFIHLLSKKHTKQLQQRLIQQLKNIHKSDSDEDLLLNSWKHAYDSRKLLTTVDKARVKDYDELRHDYYKIIDIATELIECLEQTCNGKTISPNLFSNIANKLIESNQEAEKRMQRSAMTIHKRTPPTLPITKRNRSLSRKIPENNSKRKPESIKKSESIGNLVPADPKSQSPPHQQKNQPSKPSSFIESFKQLNFTKISNQLVKNPNTRSSALLIQSLRLQLTKKGKLTDSIPILQIFTEKDVLLLKNRKNSVVATIVAQTEQQLDTKEQISRLLNAIASFKCGRDYLLSIAQGKELLYQLALALRTKKLINFGLDHTLACLEKLSIRSNVQKELVLSGMIEWLLNYLESSNIGNFGLEYGIALLTNLCMNSVSQSTIFRYKDKLLDLLKKMITHINLQLISSSANALYVLFGFAKMRSAAKEVDFDTIISERLRTLDSPELEAQLNVVLKILQGEIEIIKRKDVDEDDEDDYVEAEIDSTDTLIPSMTELFGETLLQKKYSLIGQQCNNNNSIVDDTTLPPGTVPRKHVITRNVSNKHVKPYVRRDISNNVSNYRRNGGGRDYIPREPIPMPPKTPPDQRMNSMASFATFVAENDKRKPLIGQTGLKIAVQQWKQNHKKSKTKESPKDSMYTVVDNDSQKSSKKSTENSVKSTDTVKTYRHRRKSESSITEEASLDTSSHPSLKASTSMTLTHNDAAPVIGKMNTRVPGDANVNEYVAVFGSRPKVLRTPEQSSSTNKPKPTVYMY